MSEKLDNNKCIFFEEFNNTKDNLTVKKEDIINQLKEVFDPEIPVNIYDLGLIYEIKINDEKIVNIEMTLTSPNCLRKVSTGLATSGKSFRFFKLSSTR